MKKPVKLILVALSAVVMLFSLCSCSKFYDLIPESVLPYVHTHRFRSVVTPATCTEQGYTTHTCRCGEYYIDSYTYAYGHDFTDYIYDENATCTSDGTETAYCKHFGCSYKLTRTVVGTMLEHSFTEAVEDKYLKTPANCVDSAVYYKSCADCGLKNNDTFTHGTATTHSFVNGLCPGCEHYDATPYLEFSLYNGYEVIAVDKNNLPSKIIIPDSYNGQPVTEIGYAAFEDCDKLTSVIIGNNVTLISASAFDNCVGLTSVVIGDSVETIGSLAFADCASLRSIVIPDSVTSISNQVFSDCSSLTSVKIGDSVTSIGSSAFGDCDSLTSIEIPDSVTTIGDWAFAHCSSLTSIVIGKNVTEIGRYAFNGCFCLYEVINNSNLTFSFESEEHGCIALNAVIIVDKDGNKTYKKISYPAEDVVIEIVETEDRFLFIKGTDKLDSQYDYYALVAYLGGEDTVTLPENINGYDYIIYGLRGIVNLVIPSNMNNIDGITLTNSYSLNSITVASDNPYYKSIDGSLYSKDGKTLIKYVGKKTDTSFTVPAGVETIGEYAFYNCDRLTSIIIGNNVTEIGEGAFV